MTGSNAATRRVKFATEKTFMHELKGRVAGYFDERGLSDRADRRMVWKTVLVLALTFVPYGLILTGWFSPWAMLGLAGLMGVGMAGVGFSVSHDALHGAYSSSRRVNGWLGLSFDLMGASGYSLSTLFWVFVKDYKYLLQKDLGPYHHIRHPKGEVAKLVGMKLVYYGYTIVVPLLVLDIAWWQFAIGYLAMHLTAGLILGVVFQLAHVVEGPEQFATPTDDRMEDSWLVHEMKTTSDFGRRNGFLSWYVGGLNFQVEHHLFPRICSIHYPAISPIVEEVARKYGIPYHSQRTFFASLASHLRMLKTLGAPLPVPVPVATRGAARS